MTPFEKFTILLNSLALLSLWLGQRGTETRLDVIERKIGIKNEPEKKA